MHNLKDYILEKFHITKDSKLLYKYYPKDRSELRKILEKRLAKDKNADLNDIDVSKVDDMSALFERLDPHNIKIDQWDVFNVKDMSQMFWGCKNFNCNLDNWDVSNVKYMAYMFGECKTFEGIGLENWNPVKCKDMDSIFDDCPSLKNKPSWYKE